jgi:hypothetical protein
VCHDVLAVRRPKYRRKLLPLPSRKIRNSNRKITKQGKDTDCEDPEYGDPDLLYMKPRKQPTPEVIKTEENYNNLMVKYDFRFYGCKSKMVNMVDDNKEGIHLLLVYQMGND